MNHIRLSGTNLEIARLLWEEGERVKARLKELQEENNRLNKEFQDRCFQDGEKIKQNLGIPSEVGVAIDTQYLSQHQLAFMHVPEQPVIERNKRELN